MNVREIVKEYLEKNSYDGIFCEDECGCGIDDLFPCGEFVGDCEPGHKIQCNPETCKADGCCPYHIGEKTIEERIENTKDKTIGKRSQKSH